MLTGETGAGKTVLAHALDLLLGGRAKPGIVRPGAAEAYVEGVFELPDALRGELGERLPADADEVVLARRIGADGRTRALVNGRSATVTDLRELAEPLITFYGQHEHRKLTLAGAQLDILDGFCGDAQLARRAKVAAAHAVAREAQAALAELRELAGARERELDLLDFELAEIDAAEPSEEEAAELRAERERLRHVEALRAASLAAAEAAGADDAGIASLLATAGRGLLGAQGIDPALDALAERWQALLYEVDDVAGELRSYAEAPRRRARPPGRRRGAPGGARSARAQARRHDRGGARARRGLPRAPRGARGRRGRDRGRDGAAGGGPRAARGGRARRCTRRAPPPGPSCRRPCAGAWTSSR